MKKTIHQLILALIAIAGGTVSVQAQELNVMYYLDENRDSCLVQEAAYLVYYEAHPDDPQRRIKWTQKKSGTIESKETYMFYAPDQKWKSDGLQTYYRENGLVQSQYTNRYDPEGCKCSRKEGLLESFYETGSPVRKDYFKAGEFVEGQCWGKNGQDTAHFDWYVRARFPGNETNPELRYISRNVIYPEEAKSRGIQGKVFVGFTIEADGSLSHIRVARSAHPLLDVEAVRVVQSMPNWEPAIFEGKPVRMGFTVPINFKLQ